MYSREKEAAVWVSPVSDVQEVVQEQGRFAVLVCSPRVQTRRLSAAGNVSRDTCCPLWGRAWLSNSSIGQMQVLHTHTHSTPPLAAILGTF